ncbi:hypothetical protein [Saccharopolyspora shandongensis]|uniref:hypothetical protein n=1 Tax=Saccharopolyspora shandongensis TaxID=418495 RepID=UPI0033F83F31
MTELKSPSTTSRGQWTAPITRRHGRKRALAQLVAYAHPTLQARQFSFEPRTSSTIKHHGGDVPGQLLLRRRTRIPTPHRTPLTRTSPRNSAVKSVAVDTGPVDMLTDRAVLDITGYAVADQAAECPQVARALPRRELVCRTCSTGGAST